MELKINNACQSYPLRPDPAANARALSGNTLTITSAQSPTPYNALVDLKWNNAVITTRIARDSQPGPTAGDYVRYYRDLAVSAVKQ